MKKILMILAVLTIGFMSCTKDTREEVVFGEPPNSLLPPAYYNCYCGNCNIGLCIPMDGGRFPYSCPWCGEPNDILFGGHFFVTLVPECIL